MKCAKIKTCPTIVHVISYGQIRQPQNNYLYLSQSSMAHPSQSGFLHILHVLRFIWGEQNLQNQCHVTSIANPIWNLHGPLRRITPTPAPHS